MTDDDKKEVQASVTNSMLSKVFEERVRQIIGWVDSEKRLKRSEYWSSAGAYIMIAFTTGLMIGIVLASLRH